MATMVEMFLSLSTEDKDKFCEQLLNLGLISEINPAIFNKRLKLLINTSNSRLKKLYKNLRVVGFEGTNRFFGALTEYYDDDNNIERTGFKRISESPKRIDLR